MSGNTNSLIAAIEGDYAGMSHADLVLTCKMLLRGRTAWQKEFEELKARLEQPGCLLAGPGRGDCEHFVGLPGLLVAGHHTDDYGKPNSWCWFCWWSYRTHKAEASAHDMAKEIAQLRADKAELVSILQRTLHEADTLFRLATDSIVNDGECWKCKSCGMELDSGGGHSDQCCASAILDLATTLHASEALIAKHSKV